MRKFYTLVVSALIWSFLSLEAIAQAPAPDWTKLFAGPTGKGGAAREIRVVNGFAYVAGSGGSIKGVEGIYVVKYDVTNGNPANPFLVVDYRGARYPYDMEVDASGNIYIAAEVVIKTSANSTWDTDFLTMKFNANGTLAWAKTYSGPHKLMDCALALAVDNNGNVYVTGGTDGLNSTNASAAVVTIKYNSNGDLQWVARLDDFNPGQPAVAGGPYESGQDITFDENGDVYISGESNRRMYIAKYAGNYNGTGYNPELWKDFILEGTNGRAIAISNGNVIVSGSGGAIASYTTDGVFKWTKGHASTDFWDMAVNGSGIYATGRLGRDMLTIKYDHDGNLQWDETFNASTDYATGRAIALDQCSNAFVTGSVKKQEGKNLVDKLPVIKYNQSGERQWEAYNGLSGYDITTDLFGAVYVTGFQSVKGLGNFITAKYPSGCISPAQSVSPFTTMEESGLNSLSNFPNPFKSSTNISFRLAKAGFVSLNVYDLTGRKIQTLIQEKRNAGQHSVKFSGNNLAAGTYIYRLEADGYSKTGRMILEK